MVKCNVVIAHLWGLGFVLFCFEDKEQNMKNSCISGRARILSFSVIAIGKAVALFTLSAPASGEKIL